MIDSMPDKIKARNYIWAGYSVAQIVQIMPHLKAPTIYAWKRDGKWDKASSLDKSEARIDFRYSLLMNKEHKSDKDYRELEFLGKEMERMARLRKHEKSGNGADINPKLSKRRKGKKLDPSKKNYLTEEQIATLRKAFIKEMFAYQQVWYQAKKYDIRNILKSRQIGATYYFAHEAIMDAIETGDNQVFLSASKAQAHIFKEYIVAFVYKHTGVELKGDPITLWNGATLYFLGTNSKTAQGYHGHLYQDEYFWTNKFDELQRVVSGMSLHDKWRKTYFSTPSTTTHEAYKFWNGKRFNKGRKKSEHINVDVSHENLKDGKLCAYNQWRQMVTVEDVADTAVVDGKNLFNLEKIKLEYSEADYRNLLMCEFMDDSSSIFTLKELQTCMVDSWEKWTDFKPLIERPFGHRPVWVGYDPSRSKDNSSLVVIAPPLARGGKYRILEKHSYQGMDFATQGDQIREITKRYNVEYIGIDVSGLGLAVFELVEPFFPEVTAITYSVDVKNRMVLKAKDLVSNRAIEYDTSWNDMTMSLMSISKEVTPSGRHVSYQSSRSEETGHGDLAWAALNALDNREFTDDIDDGRDDNESILMEF